MAAHQRGEFNENTCIKTPGTDKAEYFLNTKALNIIWGGAANNNRYWKTITIPGSKDGKIVDVVELVGVYWLELSGKIPLDKLTAGTRYKLTFTVKLRDGASGWNNFPVIFKLRSQGQIAVADKKKLCDLERNKWTEVPAGGLHFTAPTNPTKNQMLTFAMYEIECEEWKDGLIVEGVTIQPVGN